MVTSACILLAISVVEGMSVVLSGMTNALRSLLVLKWPDADEQAMLSDELAANSQPLARTVLHLLGPDFS